MMKYRDKTLSIEERTEDLLARMTLLEKARQIDQYFGISFVDKANPNNPTSMAADAEILWDKVKKEIGDAGVGCIHDLYADAPVNNRLQKYAVEKTRLGIPILFSEEALHGLFTSGCTIFPQSITTAATWNTEMARRIGRGIAAETRCRGIHETFAPVIDLAREPRWGRLEETFGEDTCLAGKMAEAMVRGLQGNNLKDNDAIIAEPKHFVGYGQPIGGINMSANLTGQRELMMYFLPVFEAAIRRGGALNVMCSYNSIDGVPCAGDRRLLTDLLRGEWGMKGFVRSDLGAEIRLYTAHKTAATKEDALRQALEAGLDMQYYDFEHDFYQQTIIRLIEQGKMSVRTLDDAARRVLRVKFMLGLFENPYTDESLTNKVARCASHAETALEAARESVCLLKNEGGILPLGPNIKRVAVVGPNADVMPMGDYTPTVEGFRVPSVLDAVKSIVPPGTEVVHARGVSITRGEIQPFLYEWIFHAPGVKGLWGEYYNNETFSGTPVLSRMDSTINFNWIYTKPAECMISDGFSVVWTGTLIPPRSFTGRIGVKCFDHMRLYIDGKLTADRSGHAQDALCMAPFEFEAGREYAVRIEYVKKGNGAAVIFGWDYDKNVMDEAIQMAAGADAIIAVMGDSPETCGEGYDMAGMTLPGRQTEFLQALYRTGKPVVLVLQNGRPYAIRWEYENLPAVVEAWYGGERGAQAIAEVLFGLVNPSGRLPVSFPAHAGQLPVYYNRPRGGQRRYVDMGKESLIPFGFGLGYTSFAFENLILSKTEIKAGEQLAVTADVVNTGDRAGAEVVQLYLRDLCSSMVLPDKNLRAFEKVHLAPGERKTVAFELGFDDMKLLDRDFQWVVEPGEFEVVIGKNSVDESLKAAFMVI